MKTWRVEVTAARRSLAETKTQRGILEVDTIKKVEMKEKI